MKRILLIALVALSAINVHAQYKKASFLSKSGRTHDLGGTVHFTSTNGSITPGLFYSYGRDNGQKRLFHWFDLEVLLPSKFAYETEDATTQDKVMVTGKTNIGLVYRYNLACYLLDNTNEDNKLLPFVTGGLNLLITGGTAKNYEIQSTTSYDVKKYPVNSTISLGANLGAGVIYNITQKFGLKLAGGFNFQENFVGTESNENIFHVYQSHPYASLGARFTIRDND